MKDAPPFTDADKDRKRILDEPSSRISGFSDHHEISGPSNHITAPQAG